MSEVLRILRSPAQAPRAMALAGGEVVVISRPKPQGADANEDAALIFPVDAERAVVAVADGAGGHAAGAEAADAALAALAEALGEATPEGSLRAHVLDGIERANARVTALGVGAATTLAVVEIGPTGVRPYHVGDSEILVTGQRGRLKLQIVPHSPTGYAVESGFLAAEEAIDHEERHMVSNLVGNAEMRIEIGPRLPVRPHDTLLLATDGLFDNLRADEIVEVIRKGPLRRAALALEARALERMTTPREDAPSKPDDLTLLLWRPRPALTSEAAAS